MEGKKNMQTGYLVDTGVLIMPGEYEYDAYAVAYDRAYGYYDENQWYELDRDCAIAAAQRYVDEGVDRSYGIVSEVWLDETITQQDIDNGNVDVDEHYLLEDVIFGIAKLDGANVEICQH